MSNPLHEIIQEHIDKGDHSGWFKGDLKFFEKFSMTESFFSEYHDGRFRRFMALYQR